MSVNNVSRTQAVGDKDNEPALPGELVTYADGYEFGGDGQTSVKDITAIVIERAARGDAGLAPFVGNDDAAQLGGQYVLQFNQHLNQDLEQPIPRGEIVSLPASMELKNLLGPWAEKLDQLKVMVSMAGAPQTNSLGVSVPQGTGLPLFGEPGVDS